MSGIEGRIIKDFGASPGVFDHSGQGFVAYLHYSIFTCQAD